MNNNMGNGCSKYCGYTNVFVEVRFDNMCTASGIKLVEYINSTRRNTCGKNGGVITVLRKLVLIISIYC